MNRPNEKIWLSLESMKLLKELNLTDTQLHESLKYLWPDVYTDETARNEQISAIKNRIEPYGNGHKKNWEFLARDMEEIKKELLKIGIDTYEK